MSKREAYEYTTALNTLLADRDRVQRIGGDTVISWARCGDNAYRDVWDQYMGQSGGLSEKVVVDAHVRWRRENLMTTRKFTSARMNNSIFSRCPPMRHVFRFGSI